MRAGVYLVVGLVVAIALLAGLWPLARHRLIYPGGTLSPDRSDPASHGLPHGDEVRLQADDGTRIHAWWVPARDRGPDPGRSDPDAAGRGDGTGAVIYCHGNAETIATRAWIADRLSRLGYDVLLYDYRGYGLSEGRASEEGLARDARAAWRHVVDARGVRPDRIVLMGHSLGSAVATRLALEVEAGHLAGAASGGAAGPIDLAGLVVGAPFPGMPDLFAEHAPWLPDRALRWRTDRLDAGSRLGEVRAPILVVIGTEDDVIPPGMSREVYRAAAERAHPDGGAHAGQPLDGTAPRLVTVPAEHATMMGHPDVWAALREFLGRALARR